VAKYKKKRARELQHDKFRDAAGRIFDRASVRLEGKGRLILYVLGGVILAAVLVAFGLKWRHRKDDEARRALGRAIAVATTPIAGATPAPGQTGPTFATEQERAQRAVEIFQQVAAKYGDPYRTEARYFIGTNLLYVDREKGIAELTEVSKAGATEPAILAKFALAQAKESDSKYDEAAKLYAELVALNSTVVSPDTANLFLSNVYVKQGKKTEASDLLFKIVEAARKAKDPDGTAAPESGAARDAAEKLQKLDPDMYAKLTPEAPSGALPF
jgi:tetratricopeptide (TPR) repeat protein